jgi:hypothetical protein
MSALATRLLTAYADMVNPVGRHPSVTIRAAGVAAAGGSVEASMVNRSPTNPATGLRSRAKQLSSLVKVPGPCAATQL